MINIYIKKLLFLFCLLIFLFSCTPKEMKINLYTADIEAVKNGEIVQVPVELTFTMPGKDKDNDLEKAKMVVKNYLPTDSTFTITYGIYSMFFVVKTKLPLTKLTNSD